MNPLVWLPLRRLAGILEVASGRVPDATGDVPNTPVKLAGLTKLAGLAGLSCLTGLDSGRGARWFRLPFPKAPFVRCDFFGHLLLTLSSLMYYYNLFNLI